MSRTTRHLAGQWVWSEAGNIRHPKSQVPQHRREFRRGDEPAPIVGADRKPAQQVFRRDLGSEEGTGVRLSVERKSCPPGASRSRRVARKATGSDTCSITSRAVITGKRCHWRAGPRLCQGDRRAKGHVHGVDTCRLNRFAGGVQSKDVENETRQRLGANPGAAADVEKVEQLSKNLSPSPCGRGAGGGRAQTGRAPPPPPPPARGGEFSLPSPCPDHCHPPAPPRPLDDPLDPRRVHPVQRPHRPIRVPPTRRQCVEPCNLLRRNTHGWHGCPCCPAPV